MKLILVSTVSPVEYPLLKNSIIVGSDAVADICLEDTTVKPQHAIIWQNRGMFAISAANTQGPVLVNGKAAIFGQPLWPGDEITLGNARLLFVGDNVTAAESAPQPETPSPATPASGDEAVPPPQTRSRQDMLANLDPALVKKLRQRGGLTPVGWRAHWQRAVAANYLQRGTGLFSAILSMPAFVGALAHAARDKLLRRKPKKAFPHGFWQYYSELAFKTDSARHIFETTGFQQHIPPDATEVEQAAAWIFQALTTLFEYDALLENKWIEHTLLRLVDEAIADSVICRWVVDRLGLDVSASSPEFKAEQHRVWEEAREAIELEAEQMKGALGMDDLEQMWATQAPFLKPPSHLHETFPEYRHKKFLEFLTEAAKQLPRQVGAFVGEHYYKRVAEKMPAFKAQMSILSAKECRNDAQKQRIPIWKAKVAFLVGERYYLVDVAHRDRRGRLLAFIPGKPDDPGEPLTLIETAAGTLVDQKGRRVSIDRQGGVTITNTVGQVQTKVLRPTPAREIKAFAAAILHNEAMLSFTASALPKATVASERQVRGNRWPQQRSSVTPAAIRVLNNVPLVINWNQKKHTAAPQKRNGTLGIGNFPVYLWRKQKTVEFNLSPVFFDPTWGAAFCQMMAAGATNAYRLIHQISGTGTLSNLPHAFRMQMAPATSAVEGSSPAPGELIVTTHKPDLPLLHRATEKLTQYQILISVDDLLILYRNLHNQLYKPGPLAQQAVMSLRAQNRETVAKKLEALWPERKRKPVRLIIPLDASHMAPELRVVPVAYEPVTADFALLYRALLAQLNGKPVLKAVATDEPYLQKRAAFIDRLRVEAAYLALLRNIAQRGETFSTAAMPLLVLQPSLSDAARRFQHCVGGLNTLSNGNEVFAIINEASPTTSLTHFVYAKEDGFTRNLIWSALIAEPQTLTLTLRDFRPPVLQLLSADFANEAALVAQDTLESYANGLNQFAQIILSV